MKIRKIFLSMIFGIGFIPLLAANHFREEHEERVDIHNLHFNRMGGIDVVYDLLSPPDLYFASLNINGGAKLKEIDLPSTVEPVSRTIICENLMPIKLAYASPNSFTVVDVRLFAELEQDLTAMIDWLREEEYIRGNFSASDKLRDLDETEKDKILDRFGSKIQKAFSKIETAYSKDSKVLPIFISNYSVLLDLMAKITEFRTSLRTDYWTGDIQISRFINSRRVLKLGDYTISVRLSGSGVSLCNFLETESGGGRVKCFMSGLPSEVARAGSREFYFEIEEKELGRIPKNFLNPLSKVYFPLQDKDNDDPEGKTLYILEITKEPLMGTVTGNPFRLELDIVSIPKSLILNFILIQDAVTVEEREKHFDLIEKWLDAYLFFKPKVLRAYCEDSKRFFFPGRDCHLEVFYKSICNKINLGDENSERYQAIKQRLLIISPGLGEKYKYL